MFAAVRFCEVTELIKTYSFINGRLNMATVSNLAQGIGIVLSQLDL